MNGLRVLIGKKHFQINLQHLRKVWIWTLGLFLHQINSLSILILKQTPLFSCEFCEISNNTFFTATASVLIWFPKDSFLRKLSNMAGINQGAIEDEFKPIHCRINMTAVCSFFCFRPFIASFVQKIYLTFWCYLINLLTVYWQET